MKKKDQLFVGVEDATVIRTAVTAQVKKEFSRPALEDYCRNVDNITRQGLGNFYVVRGYMLSENSDTSQMLTSKNCIINDPQGDLVKLFEYAAGRGIYTMTIYTQMTKEVVSELKRRCGKYYLGNNLGEVTLHKVSSQPKNMYQAAKAWVNHIRKSVRKSWQIGQPHVTCTNTTLYTKYCLEAGMDFPTAEIFTIPCVDVQFAQLRGAARGYNSPFFGGWLATGWFSGKNNRDPGKKMQWKLVMNSGFMHGSNFLIQESGHWGLYEFSDTEGDEHPLSRTYRKIQKDFYAFALKNPRTADGPEVKIGLIHGNLDGYSGHREDIWGQPGWNSNAYDDGWELLKVFYPASWNVNSNIEITDNRHPRFSGTPYGQVDIVPAETKVKNLSRYKTLLFLGWNTMDDDQYRRLIAYVRGGGNLVMWASHCNASRKHNAIDYNTKLYNKGNLKDLFGVQIAIPHNKKKGTWRPVSTYINRVTWTEKGLYDFPVGKEYYNSWPHGGLESKLGKGVRVLAVSDRGPFVTERRLGKGRALLVHCYSPQGHGAYREFSEDLFESVGRIELSSFRVDGNSKISYAVYGKGKNRFLYVLNTNTEKTETVKIIGLSNGEKRTRLGPGQLKKIDWS